MGKFYFINNGEIAVYNPEHNPWIILQTKNSPNEGIRLSQVNTKAMKLTTKRQFLNIKILFTIEKTVLWKKNWLKNLLQLLREYIHWEVPSPMIDQCQFERLFGWLKIKRILSSIGNTQRKTNPDYSLLPWKRDLKENYMLGR